MKPEDAARLSELGERFALDETAQEQLAAFLTLLEEDPQAPSAVTEPSKALDRHVADALVGLEIPDLAAARSLADLGSGAGVPGLVLAIALPGAQVLLVESQARKSAFLLRVVDRLGLANAEVVNARVEECPASDLDVVTARALAPAAVVLEYAAPLLRLGGLLVDFRGRRDAGEEATALRAADELGMERLEIRPVRPFAEAEHRHLHVYGKRVPTPTRFPRRPGIARKRPLAGG